MFSGFLTLCPGAISRRRQVSEGIVVRTSRPSNEEYQEIFDREVGRDFLKGNPMVDK